MNDMIRITEDNMVKTSLPEDRKRDKEYLNMLYIIKGRQNQRYIDLLNTGVAAYNKQLSSLDADVASVTADYQRALTSKAGVTKENWDTLNALLTQTYMNVANAPAIVENNKLANFQLRKAEADTITSEEAAKKAQNENNGTNVAYLPELLKSKSIFSEVKDSSGQMVAPQGDNIGQLKDGSIYQMTKQMMANKVIPEGIQVGIGDAIKNRVRNASTTADIEVVKNQVVDFVNEALDDVDKRIKEATTQQEVDELTKEKYAWAQYSLDWMTAVQTGAEAKFKTGITTSAKDIADALRHLTGKGSGMIFDDKPIKGDDQAALDNWVNQFKNKIDESMLKNLVEYYKMAWKDKGLEKLQDTPWAYFISGYDPTKKIDETDPTFASTIAKSAMLNYGPQVTMILTQRGLIK